MEIPGKHNLELKVKSFFLFYSIIGIISLLISCSFIDMRGLDSFEKEITSFIFHASKNNSALICDVVGTVTPDAVTITVPYGTNLHLTPTITIKGKSINPANETAQTFVDGAGVLYTVTGDDDSKRNYLVTVNMALSQAKDITAFAFLKAKNPLLPNDIVGAISGTNININVPQGTDTTSLIPTVSITGTAINPGNNVAQSFPEGTGVQYTVTAGDNTTKVYTVTVYAPPVAGNSGILNFSGITPYTVTVNWTKATDTQTPQADLQYLVYYSTNNNINTVTDIEANGTAFGAFTADINVMTVTGLNAGTQHYFAVLVKDQNNARTAYATNTVFTADGIPPVPGNSGLLEFSNATAHSLTVTWTKATDNAIPQADLQYLLYYSTTNSLNTVSSTESTGTPFGVYATDINTITVTGLDDATTYYFNVIVKDNIGNKAVYTKADYFIPDAIPPAQASVTNVTENNTQVTLEWTDPVDADFEYIEITWTPGGAGANSISKGTQVFTASGLTNGTEYTFSIVSVDDVSNKSAAVVVKAVPTSNGPFICYSIYTAADLNAVRGGIKAGWDKTKSYILMADIDLSGYSPWTPIGISKTDCFSGNFNGNGHIITGLYINTSADYQGLFGYISGPCILKNIRIANCNITGGKYTGILAGVFDQEGTGKAQIINCHVTGTITGTWYLGGLVGWLGSTIYSVKSKVQRCSVNTAISTTAAGAANVYIGGMTGRLEGSWIISESYSTGTMVNTDKSLYIGGLAGSTNGIVENCFSRIDIIGSNYIGGLVGGTTYNITNSYATGDITQGGAATANFGGLSGNGGTVSGYYCGTLIGTGIVDNAYGTRKTELEMQMSGTYAGWDFAAIWAINPAINNGFPYLVLNMP